MPNSKSRIVRFELDSMVDCQHFVWRPYVGVDVAFLPDRQSQRLWTAKCPLIFNEVVEWCYPDRVTRQFGYSQDIPFTSPEVNHYGLHDAVGESIDWPYIRQIYIQAWADRARHIMASPHFRPAGSRGCTIGYRAWYDRVTRRFILNPEEWATEEGFQGTQGTSQYYVSIQHFFYNYTHAYVCIVLFICNV